MGKGIYYNGKSAKNRNAWYYKQTNRIYELMADLSGSQKIHRPIFGNMNSESWFPVYHLSYHFSIYPESF